MDILKERILNNFSIEGFDLDIDNVAQSISDEIEDANKDIIKNTKRKNRTNKACDIEIPDELDSMLKTASSMLSDIERNNIISCDANCQYDKKKAVLKRRMEDAEKIYRDAPERLKSAEQDYYSFTSIETGKSFDEFEKEEIRTTLNDNIAEYKRRFNEYKAIIKTIHYEKDTDRKEEMTEYLKELHKTYDEENDSLKNNTIDNKIKLTEREIYYKTEDIETFKTLNLLVTIFLFVVVWVYMYLFLYVYTKKDFKTNLKTRIIPIWIVFCISVGIYWYTSKSLFTPRKSLFSMIFGNFFDRFLSDTSVFNLDMGPFREFYEYICSFRE